MVARPGCVETGVDAAEEDAQIWGEDIVQDAGAGSLQLGTGGHPAKATEPA